MCDGNAEVQWSCCSAMVIILVKIHQSAKSKCEVLDRLSEHLHKIADFSVTVLVFLSDSIVKNGSKFSIFAYINS